LLLSILFSMLLVWLYRRTRTGGYGRSGSGNWRGRRL
jgi:hypothetical protein